MRNRLNLSPKAKTTVSVKRTLVYASVGAGLFVLLITGAFFYLNMGNSEESLAAVPIATIEASVNNGNWDNANHWNLSPRRKPISGDTIKIPANITFIIDKSVTLSNVSLLVYGTLIFDKAQLTLNGISEIIFYPGSIVEADGAPGHNHIKIGNTHLKTNDIQDLTTPIYFDLNSGNSGKPIPADKLSEGLLPIVLDYFTAEVTPKNSVLVEWGTVSEKENDFFTLERSSDGKTFETIATIEGAGNSVQKLQYSFEDEKSTAGMNYYRLKQTDYNGDFEYFKIVGVNNVLGSTQGATISKKEMLVIGEAYPNPFKSEINLNFESENDGNVEVIIQDSRGAIVHKEIISVFYGSNEYKFSKGDQLQPGIYYINVWSNGKKFKPQRLIKI